MVTYIYFVKCPNCEDEPFDFFDDAKAFARGCLSQKPIITQTEVERNDFGECTDSSDLGQIWSWEDECGEPEVEPDPEFSKDDIGDYDPDADPEFADDDFFAINAEEHSPVAPAEVTARKPIPDGMTIEDLVEEMEKNEDMVECAGCEELFPKDDCTFNKEIGWLCDDCADSVVKCTWCDELYDKSECRYEVDLGWLCSRCEAAIKSRGETLTFKEGNYWDFLDEDTELTEASLSDIAAAANSEFGSSWNSDDLLDMAGTEDDFRHTDIHTGMTPSEKAKYDREREEEKAYKAKLARWKKYQKTKQEDLEPEVVHDLGNTYDGGYPETRTWVCYYNGNDLGTVEAATEEEAYLKMEKTWPEYNYNNEDVQVIPVDELEESTSKVEKLEEADEYRKRLTTCPECGNESYDAETSFCLKCGFN